MMAAAILVSAFFAGPAIPEPDGRTATGRLADFLRERFQVRLNVNQATFRSNGALGSISVRPAPRDAAEHFACLCRQELSIYPASVFRFSKLRQVVLCRDLRSGGKPAAGLADWTRGAIYFDVGDLGEYGNVPFTRHTVHHEFYHIIDHAENGDRGDLEWAWLNPEGAEAYREFEGDRFVETPIDERKPTGFVSDYARTSIVEDKAETFSCMVLSFGDLNRRCEFDLVLRAKRDRIQESLYRLMPSTSDRFWRQREQTSVRSPGMYRQSGPSDDSPLRDYFKVFDFFDESSR